MASEMAGLKVWVRGIVQGVGFRPFIFNLAESLGLKGWVKNTSNGVEIEVNGEAQALQQFIDSIRKNPPPLARIDEFVSQPVAVNGFTRFEIVESQQLEGAYLPISPDVAICPDCRRELFDPSNRRYRYPFINCTNCGPRFSIIRDIPYDRPKTTMAGFTLCPRCQAEYDDPRDRRFHAQPVACPDCGPQIWLESNDSTEKVQGELALQTARALLQKGRILAIKGLGGYHLACDAGNAQAVAELRQRKQRSDKAFALMAFDLAAIRKYCAVSEEEAQLLTAHQAPIVLLDRLPQCPLPAALAPGQHTLGWMLPYTPLHLLLLEPASGFPEALVMTSGNLSEEPIAYQDGDAQERLGALADAFLLHDRPIHMRVDDSVARVIQQQPYLVRRSRGYAPDSILLPHSTAPTLAAGAELKNTFCLARDSYAFLSHHIGDLENYETLRSFEEGIRHFEQLFRVHPERIVCDLHPDYLATRYAQQRAREEHLPLIQVQHHHAHLAACLADHHWRPDPQGNAPVIGLIFDGTGLGTDGAIWGGECLVGGYAGYQRRFHLAYAPLPGGDQAVRKPARMALAHLQAAGMEWEPDLPPVETLCADERTLMRMQIERKINTPLTSSMGRLFDAASALIGVRQKVTYEGQAAIELEAWVDPAETGSYPFDLRSDIIDPAPFWAALLDEWRDGVSTPILAARIHNSVAQLCLDVCRTVRSETGSRIAALSGGVWQNRYLLEQVKTRLEEEQFEVFIHHQVPANDGCIALGQVMVAAFQTMG